MLKLPERAVFRILLSFSAMLAACNPSSQEAAMRNPGPISGAAAQAPGRQAVDSGRHAAQGPIPEPVSAAGNPVPAPPLATDSPEEARGRRTLSTAFVMVGPDGHLTVERHDGRVLVLRDVVMRRTDYCGRAVLGDKPGARYCGSYAEVAAARPGGAPATD